jgi:hypothetical protein
MDGRYEGLENSHPLLVLFMVIGIECDAKIGLVSPLDLEII